MNKARPLVSLVSILLFMPNDNEVWQKETCMKIMTCSLGIQTLQKYYGTP